MITRKEALRKIQAFIDFCPAIKAEMEETIEALSVPQWISVEDDLPCNHQEMIQSDFTDKVLILSRNGCLEVTFMCVIEGKWDWGTLTTVLYWMPIPELSKLEIEL